MISFPGKLILSMVWRLWRLRIGINRVLPQPVALENMSNVQSSEISSGFLHPLPPVGGHLELEPVHSFLSFSLTEACEADITQLAEPTSAVEMLGTHG